MKVTVIFLFVACIAFSFSAPASRAVDWSAVDALVTSIDNSIHEAFKDIVRIAIDDDSDVSLKIAVALVFVENRTKIITDAAKAEIEAKTFNLYQAVQIFGLLLNDIKPDQIDIKKYLSELSNPAASAINKELNDNYASVQVNAQEIYHLL